MSNRRLDWLLWMLLTKIEVHYWHNQNLKEEDFLRNVNVERITSTSWARALKILDDDCLLHENIPGAFWVRSQNENTRWKYYVVSLTESQFSLCNCPWSLLGNVCKHSLKVGMLKANGSRDQDVVLKHNPLHRSNDLPL